jgi:hypothetical protein
VETGLMKKFWLFRVEAFEIAGSIALLPLCTEAGHSSQVMCAGSCWPLSSVLSFGHGQLIDLICETNCSQCAMRV